MFASPDWPLYSLSGLLVGILVGITGVGGGSLMTPLLILLFGFHPATAVGTDLLFATATKSVGSAVHRWKGTIDWRIVGWMAAGSVPASAATLFVLAKLGGRHEQVSATITFVLGFALVLTALAVVFRPLILRYAHRHASLDEHDPRVRGGTLILGIVLGVAVTLSSVGAGAIGVTALILLYPRLPTGRIVGTDIAHAVPLTLVSGAGHWFLGSVDLGLLGALLTGSIPGVIIGSLAAGRMHERVLRPLLAAVLLIVAIRLLTQ